MTNTRSASIVICCYNSAKRLELPLRSMAEQELPDGFAGELILVDNNSTDDTSQVAAALWDALGAPGFTLRIVPESEQGLQHARLRGIQCASHECCFFVDDDVVLSKRFLATALRLFDQHADTAVFGGWVDPLFEPGLTEPEWFRSIDGVFTVGNKGDTAHACSSAPGAAMMLRLSVVRALLAGGFEFMMRDRTAATLSGGGDTELCLALQVLGWRVYYDPELRISHLVPASRLKWSYIKGVARGMGHGEVFLQTYRKQLELDNRDDRLWVGFKYAWIVQLVGRSLQAARCSWRSALQQRRGQQVSHDRIMAEIYLGMVEMLLREWRRYRSHFARVRELSYRKQT
ncbi:MAG: glycosyltransferase family 2 protein [Planctomycetales bacterium]|nr:glycosyltransferase family 2 protein [Planctomycetales bacterium]